MTTTRSQRLFVLVSFLLVLGAWSSVLATACAGSQARTHVLWPTVASTWPGVKANVQHGMDKEGVSPAGVAAVVQVDRAVAADDRTLVRGVDFVILEELGQAGVRHRIADSGISAGVALSVLERDRVFFEALRDVAK